MLWVLRWISENDVHSFQVQIFGNRQIAIDVLAQVVIAHAQTFGECLSATYLLRRFSQDCAGGLVFDHGALPYPVPYAHYTPLGQPQAVRLRNPLFSRHSALLKKMKWVEWNKSPLLSYSR